MERLRLDFWVALLLLFPQSCECFQGTFDTKRTAGRPLTFVRAPHVVKPKLSSSASRLYFFGRKNANANQNVADKESEEPVAVDEPSSKEQEVAPPKQAVSLSPQEQATKLRADAERARLEAQRMDAELTLRKIEALEKKVKKKKGKPEEDDDGAKLQEEISRLSQKFKEQTTEPVTQNNEASPPKITMSPLSSTAEEVWATEGVVWPKFVIDSQDNEILESIDNNLRFLPNVIKTFFVVDLAGTVNFNKTAVSEADQFSQFAKNLLLGDFSDLKVEEPRFNQSELDKAIEKMENFKKDLLTKEKKEPSTDELAEMVSAGMMSVEDVDDEVIALVVLGVWGNAVERRPEASTVDKARLLLEYQYFAAKLSNAFLDDVDSDMNIDKIMEAASQEWFLKPLFREQGDGNRTMVSFLDNIMDSLFPKSTTQLKNENPVLPPQAKVDLLASEILPQTLFRATSRPEPVLGGFVIKGSSIPDEDETYGDKVIQSINEKLAQRKYAAVAEAMTVTYVPDFMYLENAEGEMFFADEATNPPLLYICGPNIARSSRPVQLSIVSAFGLATTWYLSLYPFLLNRGIASRVDEELAMIDAGVMAPNLSWLTELSLPLFITFGSIQLLHEVAHGVAAKANGVRFSRIFLNGFLFV